MTKPLQATIFRKRQILPARGLNKALQEYGSVDGVVPYKEDGTQDGTMSAPLGTKSASFGDAYFRGFNIYTQLEVQQLVESGKLTAANRMVFWNLDTNNLSAWNGTEIIHLGNNGGGNMDYLFGNGSDGDIIMVSDGTYDTVKNFTNFTLNAGVTLSRVTAGSPMIIKCRGVFTLNGSINLDGKGFLGIRNAPGMGYGVCPRGTISGVTGINADNSGNFDANITYALASLLKFDSIALMGGAGGGSRNYKQNQSSSAQISIHNGGIGCASGGIGGTKNMSGTTMGDRSAAGGNGGGGLIVIAKKIIINGSISAKGLSGGNDSGYSSGGSGGGGCAVFMASEIVDNGTYDFSSGVSAGLGASVGGTGGYVKVLI